MKNIYLLIVLFLFCVCSLKSQVRFEEKFFTSGVDLLTTSIHQTNDKGYIITGTENFNGTDWNIFLLKLDSLGDTLWTKKFEHPDQNAAYYVSQTLDGGFIIGGKMGVVNGLGYFLIKTDSAGDTLWVKTFDGTSSSNVPMFVQQTTDSGYVISGLGNCLNNNDGIAIVKTDTYGNIIWSRVYGDTLPMNINGNAGIQTFDGGYIFTGRRLGNGYDAYLIKTDSNGDTLWSESISGPDHENTYSIIQTADSGFILTGFTTLNNVQHTLLIKTNSIGDTTWTKAFNEPSFHCKGYSVKQTSDNGFIVVGTSIGTDSHIFLIKTDSVGNLTWTQDFGDVTDDAAYWVEQTSDGGYIIAGLTDTVGLGGAQCYIIKTDPNGNSGCNLNTLNTVTVQPTLQIIHPTWTNTSCSITADNVSLTMNSGCQYTVRCSTTDASTRTIEKGYHIYPNPTNNILFIESETPQNFSCEIFDSIGAKILKTFNAQNLKFQIDMKDYPRGIYIIKITNEFGNFSEKIVID
jgi:hypothetical protein